MRNKAIHIALGVRADGAMEVLGLWLEQNEGDKAIHVILDNYAAHKKDKVQKWLARHPRSTFHFTPTSCSWLRA